MVEPERPNVLGWLRGSGRGPSLMLNGHLDTAVETTGWTKPVYGGDVEGDRLYGHGISNMKASNAAMMCAAAALRRADVRLEGDLLVALVVGECAGGVGTRDLMAKGVRTDAFLCGEPTDLGVLTVHACSQYLRIEITGRTGHFAAPDEGVNAIAKACALLERLGPMYRPIAPGAWMRGASKPLYAGLPRYQVSAIRGGLTRNLIESFALTPDFCEVVLNVRATPNKHMNETREDIEQVLAVMQREDAGWLYTVRTIRQMPGFEAPPGSRATEAAIAAYRAVIDDPPRVGGLQPFMFMSSDAGHMQVAGITDGVLIGPGRFTASTPDEHVEIEKMVAAARIYAATALTLCGGA